MHQGKRNLAGSSGPFVRSVAWEQERSPAARAGDWPRCWAGDCTGTWPSLAYHRDKRRTMVRLAGEFPKAVCARFPAAGPRGSTASEMSHAWHPALQVGAAGDSWGQPGPQTTGQLQNTRRTAGKTRAAPAWREERERELISVHVQIKAASSCLHAAEL